MLKLAYMPEEAVGRQTMNEHDGDGVLRITQDDIAEANKLSLNCPICAGAVEKNVDRPDMAPVYCTACETLYHHACWHRNGGHCAVLGCSGTEVRRYGAYDLEPALVIDHRDIARQPVRTIPSPNGRTKRLKREEHRRRQEAQRGGFWRLLWENLLRAIRIWPSDPS